MRSVRFKNKHLKLYSIFDAGYVLKYGVRKNHLGGCVRRHRILSVIVDCVVILSYSGVLLKTISVFALPILNYLQDYFDVIKHPMDLSTIKEKLDSGQYPDPWQYIEDVWLMFNNAWTYNRKTSRVYKFCSKVSSDIIHCYRTDIPDISIF